MKIECYLSTGCGSEDALRTNIYAALEKEGVEAEVSFHRTDDATASDLKLTGSPSVFINGKELQPGGIIGFS